MSITRYTFETKAEADAFEKGVELPNHQDVYVEETGVDKGNTKKPFYVDVNDVV